MANLIMASLQSNLSLCSWQYQLKEGLLTFPGSGSSEQDALFKYKMVLFLQEQIKLGWISQFRLLSFQSPISQSRDNQT